MTTRTGDDGTTGLGGGQRVPKDDVRIAAIGAVDELNSAIGAAIAADPHEPLAGELQRVQHDLFELGADLCFREGDASRPRDEVRPGIEGLARLDADIRRHLEDLGPLREFILPGGTPAAAALHVARCVCRRAEREVVTLSRQETLSGGVIAYLNRLSDLLFVMARAENRARGREETMWQRD